MRPFKHALFRCLAAVPLALTMATVGAGVTVLAPPAQAEAGTVLDRPTFDRNATVIMIPFRGPVPRYETRVVDGGTRLIAEFAGSQFVSATPYKLGIFHPFVSKVEMAPLTDVVRVRLTVALAAPGRMAVVPDLRRGALRVQVGRTDSDAVPQPPPPAVVGFGSGPNTPVTGSAPAPIYIPPRVESYPGQLVLTPAAPPYAPMVTPSIPPVRYSGTGMVPGTPASGEYVYRKAIPAENGRDVTEVQIRTPRRSAVDVTTNVQNDAVNVAVTPPGGTMAPAVANTVPEGWTRPLPNEPWKLPNYRREPIFRPVAALDAVIGYTLMSETARTLGTRFDGVGSTSFGLMGHIPLGLNWNINMSAETFGYAIASSQVPDAQTRRDEFIGSLAVEYLPIRRPYVLAVGLGYWGRYVVSKNNLLAPPDPSLIFAPTQLYHGPSLGGRSWVPIWGAVGIAAELSGAPYMFGGNDATATTIGAVYGYQGALGIKYSQRYFSLAAGYRYQGFGSFNGVYGYNRNGPEAQLVWRF